MHTLLKLYAVHAQCTLLFNLKHFFASESVDTQSALCRVSTYDMAHAIAMCSTSETMAKAPCRNLSDRAQIQDRGLSSVATPSPKRSYASVRLPGLPPRGEQAAADGPRAPGVVGDSHGWASPSRARGALIYRYLSTSKLTAGKAQPLPPHRPGRTGDPTDHIPTDLNVRLLCEWSMASLRAQMLIMRRLISAWA
jgi:hypothetical protein